MEDSAQFARNFGSAVDFAGNSMNATEQEVLDFSTRTAGALSLLGGSAYELASYKPLPLPPKKKGEVSGGAAGI